MPNTIERFTTVAAGFEDRVANCDPERWESPTPCPPWTASDLVDHVLDGFALMLSAVGREITVAPDADRLARWQAANTAMLDALNDPVCASTIVPSPVGDHPFKAVVGGVILHDLLVHTWDLARSTGQDEALDPEAVATALAKMQPFDELLRGPSMFGPRQPAPPGADPQTELLCFLGRPV